MSTWFYAGCIDYRIHLWLVGDDDDDGAFDIDDVDLCLSFDEEDDIYLSHGLGQSSR